MSANSYKYRLTLLNVEIRNCSKQTFILLKPTFTVQSKVADYWQVCIYLSLELKASWHDVFKFFGHVLLKPIVREILFPLNCTVKRRELFNFNFLGDS